MEPKCYVAFLHLHLIVIVGSFVRPIVTAKDRLLLQLGRVDFLIVLNHTNSLVP